MSDHQLDFAILLSCSIVVVMCVMLLMYVF